MDELMWLKRRHEILSRAIGEMEAHEVSPHLDEGLNPDIPNSLTWARRERMQIELKIAALADTVRLSPSPSRQPEHENSDRPGYRRIDEWTDLSQNVMVHKSKVALVVDDEVFARLFAVQILLDEGFTVLEAADAAEGLDVLDRNDDIAVLFTDISMPGEMDGLGLVARARRDHPDMALLVTSGRVEPAERDIPAGGRFLPKPYTAHALMSAVRELGAGRQ